MRSGWVVEVERRGDVFDWGIRGRCGGPFIRGNGTFLGIVVFGLDMTLLAPELTLETIEARSSSIICYKQTFLSN